MTFSRPFPAAADVSRFTMAKLGVPAKRSSRRSLTPSSCATSRRRTSGCSSLSLVILAPFTLAVFPVSPLHTVSRDTYSSTPQVSAQRVALRLPSNPHSSVPQLQRRSTQGDTSSEHISCHAPAVPPPHRFPCWGRRRRSCLRRRIEESHPLRGCVEAGAGASSSSTLRIVGLGLATVVDMEQKSPRSPIRRRMPPSRVP